MKFVHSLALASLLVGGVVSAQYNLPPGTSSSVPEAEQAPHSSPADDALRRAESAIPDNKFADAVTVLVPVATPSQTNERVFYDLGFAQDALGHDAEADAAYARAVKLDPSDGAARVSYGLLLARGEHRDKAEEQFSAAVRIPGIDPALQARAFRALAQIHLQNKPEQARIELVGALKLSPETPEDAALAAEIADALEDDESAAKAYAHALELAPGNATLSVEYARVLTQLKKFDEAQAVLERARRATPHNSEVLAEMASEQMLQGHAEEAIPTLEELHQAEPQSAPIALLLARAYTAAGIPEKADALFTALLKANPNEPTLLVAAGDHLIREKRSAEAEPLLQKAMEHAEGFSSKQAKADAAGELAFAASANHDPETVLKAIALRETILPSDAPFTFLQATAHDTLHHTKQAAEAYRLFVKQSAGKLPDQEWQAQQRLQVLDRMK